MSSSNEAKYETANPIAKRLISRFFDAVFDMAAPLEASSLLDVGCGEGEPLARFGPGLPDRTAAVDTEQRCVDATRMKLPEVQVSRASALELPFADGEFELVLCLEVLEHLDHPDRAARELARVAARDLLVSVPSEPWFRLGNLLRGRHIQAFGDHPEHVNHFNRRGITELFEPFAEVREVRVAFPWLILHARV